MARQFWGEPPETIEQSGKRDRAKGVLMLPLETRKIASSPRGSSISLIFEKNFVILLIRVSD
jgi:hypothetical protein